MNNPSSLRLTRPDAIKLSALAQNLTRLTSNADAHIEQLEEVIALADIVPPDDIPADVVTLNSRAVFEDIVTGMHHQITLVLPNELDPKGGSISVISPIGRALLGRAVGDTVAVDIPHGRTRHVRLLEVPFQPEAHARRAPG